MIKMGKLKITGTREFDDTLERSTVVLNIATNEEGISFVFINKEQSTMEASFDNGSTWETQMQGSETDYKVYINKTTDDIVNMYKLHTAYTLEWLTPLTEVGV